MSPDNRQNMPGGESGGMGRTNEPERKDQDKNREPGRTDRPGQGQKDMGTGDKGE